MTNNEAAEGVEHAANIAKFFASLSEGNEAGAEQVRRDENTLTRWADFLKTLP